MAIGPRLWLSIHGINTTAADAAGWQYRAEEYLEDGGFGIATSYLYQCHSLDRRLGQEDRIAAVQSIIRIRAPHFEVIDVIAHSNGAEIIVQALLGDQDLKVGRLFLLGAACSSDCRKALNTLVARGQITQGLFLYCSTADEALKAAHWSHLLLGWLGLGYGDLGLEGPQKPSPALKAIMAVTWRTCAHSDYLFRDFEQTMGEIVRSVGPTSPGGPPLLRELPKAAGATPA